MKEVSFPISDYPFFSKDAKNVIAKYNSRGYLAVAQYSILTIYIEKNNVLEIFRSTDLGGSRITTLAWSEGYTEDGWTPPLVFAGLRNGTIILYDVQNNTILSKTQYKDEYVVSSIADPYRAYRFYIGTDEKKIQCLDFSKQFNLSTPWTIELQIYPTSLSVSPFKPQQLYIVSFTGKFTFIDNIRSKKPVLRTQITKLKLEEGSSVIQSGFYPHLDDCIYIVTPIGIILFFVKDEIISTVFTIESRNELLMGAHFLQTRSDLLVLVFPTYIRTARLTSDMCCLSPSIKVPITFDDHKTIITSALYNDKLAVIESGNISLFKVADELSCTSITRNIIDEPTDFDVYENQVVIATKRGYVEVFNNGLSPSYIANVTNLPIIRVNWLDSYTILVLAKSEKRTSLLLHRIIKRSSVSLLTAVQEMVQCDDIKIFLSPNRRRFAIVFDDNFSVIFNSDGSRVNLLSNRHAFIAFSENGNSFWTVGHDRRAYLYVNQEGTIKVTKRLKAIESKGVTAVSNIHGQLIIALANGKINFHNWDGTINSSITLQKAASVIHTSGHLPNAPPSALIVDSANVVHHYDFDTQKLTTFAEKKISNLRWLNDEFALVKFEDLKAISVVSISDFTTRYSKTPPIFKGFGLFLDPDSRRRYLIEQIKSHNYENIRGLGYNLLYSIVAGIPSLTFSVQNLEKLIESSQYLYERSEGEASTLRKMRNFILAGDDHAASTALITSSNTSPQFESKLMLAIVMTTEKSPCATSVAAALTEMNKPESAIDVLLASKLYKQAIRQQLENKNFESTIHFSKLKLNEEEFKEMVLKTVKELIDSKLPFHASSLLFLIGEYEQADDLYNKYMKIRIPIADAFQ